MSKSQTEKWAKEYVSQYMDELKWRRDSEKVIKIIRKALASQDYITLKYIINSTKAFIGSQEFERQ